MFSISFKLSKLDLIRSPPTFCHTVNKNCLVDPTNQIRASNSSMHFLSTQKKANNIFT